MSQRAAIEDAVIERIRLLGEHAPAGYLKTVDPYQGPLEPDPEDTALALLMKAGTPCVGVTTDAAEFDDIPIGRRRASKAINVEIIVVSRNLRNLESGARGDGLAGDPGVYCILQDIRKKLFGVELGIDGVGFLEPERETPVERGETAIWRQTYAVMVDVVQPPRSEGSPQATGLTTRVSDADTTDETSNPVTVADIDYP